MALHERRPNHSIEHSLGERVKELTALHRTARLLKDDSRPTSDLLTEFVALLPPAWQFPEITVARVSFNDFTVATKGFRITPWLQQADFELQNGDKGSIEVGYLDERSPAAEGPFLAEERELIESLAEILQNYLQYRFAMSEIRRAHDDLELLVQARTLELRKTNTALAAKISDLQDAQREIEQYQGQLRKMSVDLTLAEARERRQIAGDLHDHIGQALAIIRMRLAALHGETIFSGFEQRIGDIISLLDQTIVYTRTLTFTISPPMLYELGLTASLEWLAEQFTKKHGLGVKVTEMCETKDLREELQIFIFKSVQELLTNTLKHSRTDIAELRMKRCEDHLEVTVSDHGQGFDSTKVIGAGSVAGFGLFSIRERLLHLGGALDIVSQPGKGAKMTITVPLT